MDYRLDRKTSSQTLLIVNHGQKLALSPTIQASFNYAYISILEASKIIDWVQEYQPDLIVLDLERTQIVELQLIPALRLDWLTRNIPILVIADSTSLQFPESLDYDACLNKPHSLLELEQTICSLISPVCKSGDRVA